MGSIFCVGLKSFEFVLDSGGKSLCLKIIKRGLGSVYLVRLDHEGIFWLLSTIEEVASSADSKGFFRKIRTACNVILCKDASMFMGLTWLSKSLVEEGGEGLFYSLKAKRSGVGVALGRCFVSCWHHISP